MTASKITLRSSSRSADLRCVLTAILILACFTNDGMGQEGERPEKKWTFKELSSAISDLQGGRSFEKGRKLYKQIKCTACHRMDGEGNEFGPDLSLLNESWTAAKILRHVLEPSLEINKEFTAYHFELKDGRTINGLVVAKGPSFVKVVDQPLKSSRSIRIRLDSILDRQASRASFMPEEMLNRLSQDEILDLIAYVASRGNNQHSLFQ